MEITNEVVYKRPLTLTGALQECQKSDKRISATETRLDIFLKNVSKNEELSNIKVSKYLGRGSSAVVFETSDGNILKLTETNHFPLNRPVQSFDVPIYKHGKAGKIHYYVEEKLFQHGLSEGFVSIMKDMIKAAGLRPYDLLDGDVFQLGMSKEGKLYLLDPECAKYKTIFHAIFENTHEAIIDKVPPLWLNRLKERYFYGKNDFNR